MHNRSSKEIRSAVVKNDEENYDANIMAQLQNERSIRTMHQKQNKMEQFISNTKLNATKIYKQQQSKKIEDSNVKKSMFEKQKEVKAKYTLLQKKKEVPKSINIEPTKVDWKRVDPASKGVSVPLERPPFNSDSQGEQSAMDSQYQNSKINSPEQLIKMRESIRMKMLNKLRGGRSK